MKRLIAALALTTAAVPALAAVDVGVSINVGQPGFYGQIDIGNAPRPVLVQPQPIVVQPVPRNVVVQPLYLVVPPGHRKHWDKHCFEYHACGRPVYFVDEGWYNDHYVPYYQEHHRGGDRDRRDDYRGDDRGYDRGDRGDDRGDDRGGWGGPGRGHGHGHGRD